MIELTNISAKIAVIDIGSNSVRLVVFDELSRLPLPLVNEKSSCALGKGLSISGKLNINGRACAIKTIQRYLRIVEAIGAGQIHIIATAAVRDAADGEEFMQRISAEVERQLPGRNIFIKTITGEEEAYLASLGVCASNYNCNGYVGDLGGGSLELVRVKNSIPGERKSMPVGNFRLLDESGGNVSKALDILDSGVAGLVPAKSTQDRNFYAVGGGFRAIAKVMMEDVAHPIHVIHGYCVDSAQLQPLLVRLMQIKGAEPSTVRGLSDDRRETIAFSAAVMSKIIEKLAIRRVIFSAEGVREGVIYNLLSPAVISKDPLFESAYKMLALTGASATYAQHLVEWLDQLLAGVESDFRRAAVAAVIMAEAGWAEHPDYRHSLMFRRGLSFPYIGASHRERMFIAIALYSRHKGKLADYELQMAQKVLSAAQVTQASAVGLACGMAHKVSRGASEVLGAFSLKVTSKFIELQMEKPDYRCMAEEGRKRFFRMAEALSLKPIFVS